MSTPSPMNKPEAPLNWDAASVELPPIPMIPPGEDAMSMTIAGVIPTLTTPLTASVAALQAKETMFSGKLGAAESAYENADESGGQSVGQLSQMLGQVGQMAQQAGGAAGGAGGGMGSFGQIMQQAMQATQGGGSSQSGSGSQAGGSPSAAGQGSAGQGAPGSAAPQQQTRDDSAAEDQKREREADKDRDRERDTDQRAPLDAAGPGGSRPGEGPVPVAPPEHPQHGNDDLARRV